MDADNFDEVGQDWCLVEEDEKTKENESEEISSETTDNLSAEMKFPSHEPTDEAVDVGTSNSAKGCDSDSSVDVVDDQDCLDECWENVGCDLISRTRRPSDVHEDDTTLSDAENLRSLLSPLSSGEKFEGISKWAAIALVAGVILCCITVLIIKRMETPSNPLCYKDLMSTLLNGSNETMPLQLRGLSVLQKQIDDLRKQLKTERKKNKELSRNVSDCSVAKKIFDLLNQTVGKNTLENLNYSVLAIDPNIWKSTNMYNQVKDESPNEDDHIMFDDRESRLFSLLQSAENSQLIVEKDDLQITGENDFTRVVSEFQSRLKLKLETMSSAIISPKDYKTKKSKKKSKIQLKGFADKFKDLAMKVLKPVKQNFSKLSSGEVFQISNETDHRLELFNFIDLFLSHNPDMKNFESFTNLKVNLISFKSALDAAARSEKSKKKDTKMLLKQLKRVNSAIKDIFNHRISKSVTAYELFMTIFKTPLSPSLADFYLGELVKLFKSRKFGHLPAWQQNHLVCQCHWWDQFHSGTSHNCVTEKFYLNKDVCSLSLYGWQKLIENHIREEQCKTVETGGFFIGGSMRCEK